MEGLISGALVMTDPMHPLPLHLENGTSLVVFESLAQLQDLVLYYLDHPQERMEIARRGRFVALNYHRSWHIMERMILGNWTSAHY
jgi:spore maturation protein CgeB